MRPGSICFEQSLAAPMYLQNYAFLYRGTLHTRYVAFLYNADTLDHRPTPYKQCRFLYAHLLWTIL